MLLGLYIMFLLPFLGAQSATELSATGLDSLLQDYAFRAFKKPKTGIIYDGNVPSNMTGMKVAAVRLRSGSMRRRGVSSFKEFHIPVGVIEQPYVERLVLVYHNLGNWSELYYPLPGYTFLAPVLGLLAYDASDLSATDLNELDIRASQKPISIDFGNVQQAPDGLSPKCVYFDLNGSVEFDYLVGENMCSATKQGHFSIVVEFSAPVPAPAPGPESSGGGKGGKRVWIIVGSVVGGLLLLGLVLVGVLCLKKCRERKKMEKMEAAADRGVPLEMTAVGGTKAPVAAEIRTRPCLENEYMI